MRDVLAGTRGPRRDVVLLNAGVALFIAGRASTTITEGIAVAAAAIDSGAAQQRLEQMVDSSRAEACRMTAPRAQIRPAAHDRRGHAADRRDAPASASRSAALERARRIGVARADGGSRRRLARRIASTSLPSASGARRRKACSPPTTIPIRDRDGSTNEGGAAAISVLTEPTFFDGALEHLAAVRAGRGAAASPEGLHRRRVPAVRGAGGRRRRGSADRGGA